MKLILPLLRKEECDCRLTRVGAKFPWSQDQVQSDKSLKDLRNNPD
jgi:hypothetical protein